MPERYVPYQTCYDRFVRFRKKGIWQSILELLQSDQNQEGQLGWNNACINGSVIRAHQHAAEASFKSTPGLTASKRLPTGPLQPREVAFTAPPSLKERVQAPEALATVRSDSALKSTGL